MSEILPGLWLGDHHLASDESFLKTKQIQMIVNCSEDNYSSSLSSSRQPTHSIIKIKFHVSPTSPQHYEQACRLINQHSNHLNILLFGSHSPLLMAIYLIKCGRMDLEQVIQALQSKKVNITPFLKNLKSEIPSGLKGLV